LNHPPHLSRRRLLLAALAGSVAPALATPTEAELAPVYALFPQLDALVRPSLMDIHQGRYREAEERLAQANAIIEADPAQRWPWRYHVLPPYGAAVLEQGRVREALPLLRQALAAREAIEAQQLPRFRLILPSIDLRLGLELTRVEYGRQLVAMIRTPQALSSSEDLAYDQRLASSDIWTLLARALAAAGEREELARLYRQRVAPMAIPAGQVAQLTAHEYRLYKIGVSLAAAGLDADARAAWRLARQANARRLNETMRQATPHQVSAAAGLRRQMLSASILAAGDAGELDAEAPDLLADLLATKGAATRYDGTMRARLASSAPDIAVQLRALEDGIAQLPATTAEAGPFMQALAQQDLVWMAAAQRMRLHSAGFPAPDAALLDGLRARLGRGAALGFMLLTPPGPRGTPPQRRYLRYCVDAGGLQLRMLGKQAGIDRLVHACRTELLGGAQASRAAAELSAQLLDGLPPAMHAATEWIVDPDGALHLLPFDALPGPDGKPLLARHAIRLATSLAAPAQAAPAPGEAAGPAAIFADPDYGGGATPAPATLRWWAGAGVGPVAPLPDTREEARAVAASLARLRIDSQVYAQDRATAEALGALRRPALLHVAAHAVLRPALESDESGSLGAEAIELMLPGRQAGLVLSRAGRADVVLAGDIARLSLQGTRLVVLSACDTANGDLAPGEAVASLRRAVELAGARSAVTAVWQVPSAATTALMTSFYARLAQGETMGAALRGAKRELLAAGSPPRAWAGFQLSGEDGLLAAPG